MDKALAFLAHELRAAALPAAFFFVAFLIGATIRSLIQESYGLTPTGVGVAFVGALIVAKAVLIADHLPVVQAFTGRPLIFTVLWKTAIYWTLCMAFRFLEELVPLWSRHGDVTVALRHLAEEASWPLILVVQLWLVVALILYNTLTALDTHFGPGSIRRAMLRTPTESIQEE